MPVIEANVTAVSSSCPAICEGIKSLQLVPGYEDPVPDHSKYHWPLMLNVDMYWVLCVCVGGSFCVSVTDVKTGTGSRNLPEYS